jgi:hypothetical protein
MRTSVNVDCVRSSVPSYGMAEETLGERLIELGRRSGLKGDALARALGYEGRSGTQRILDRYYDPEFPPAGLVSRFQSLVGKGEPPITTQEVIKAFGVNGQPIVGFTPDRGLLYPGGMSRDVPVYGTGIGAKLKVDLVTGTGQLELDQLRVESGQAIDRIRRPAQFDDNREIYGLYVEGDSMSPRYEDGATVLVNPRAQVRVGDYVVVQLLADSGGDDPIWGGLIKRLHRKTADYIELEQFCPPLVFRLPRTLVSAVHRIVPYEDLLS